MSENEIQTNTPEEERMSVFEWIKLFLSGAMDFNRKSRSMLEKEAHNEMDNFILLCFADLLGLPIPTSYYSIEILPYIAEDLEKWERRMMNRKSVWGEKWGDLDLDA